MTTSDEGVLPVLAFLVVLGAALVATGLRGVRTTRPAVVAVWLVVAVPSVLGLVSDRVSAALARDPDAVRHGQLWRLLTAAVVQDGGVAGTVFNLLTLWVFTAVSVRLRGPVTTIALLVAGALAFNLVAVFWLDVPGAGTSGATFFLATSLIGPGVGFVVALVLSVALVAGRDAHGLAFLAGLLAGAVRRRPRPDRAGPPR